MGSFSRAKLELVQPSEVQPPPEVHGEPAAESPFAPGPKRHIDIEALADDGIRRLEELGRLAGYRPEHPVLPADRPSERVERPEPPGAPAQSPALGGRQVRPRLRRRLINVPQESVTLRIPTSTVDLFDEWCDSQALTKKSGFMELVARIIHRSHGPGSEDEAHDRALQSGEGESIRGQLPRHLARRLKTEAEEPVTFYIPTSTMEAFEEWCGDRGLTKKAGFVEMVRRVTRR